MGLNESDIENKIRSFAWFEGRLPQELLTLAAQHLNPTTLAKVRGAVVGLNQGEEVLVLLMDNEILLFADGMFGGDDVRHVSLSCAYEADHAANSLTIPTNSEVVVVNDVPEKTLQAFESLLNNSTAQAA